MPTRRLRALSAWSNLALAVEAGEIGLERKVAAVGVLEPVAGVLELREQLEDQRAGEPRGVKRVDAAHLERLLLQRRDLDAAQPAAVIL